MRFGKFAVLWLSISLGILFLQWLRRIAGDKEFLVAAGGGALLVAIGTVLWHSMRK